MAPMEPLKQDLVIRQGANFQFVLQLTDAPASIAGYTVQMQGRPWAKSETIYFDWSTSGGEITINDSTKQIVINVPFAKTATLDFRQCLYDVELRSGSGATWRVMEGVATLSRENTR